MDTTDPTDITDTKDTNDTNDSKDSNDSNNANEVSRKVGLGDLPSIPWAKSLLGSIGEGIVVADEANRILYMNPQAEKVLGAALDKFKGKNIHGCHTCPWKVEEVIKGCSPEHPFREEISMGGRWISVTASPIFSEERKPIGSIMIVTDTTARKLLEETIQNQNHELVARQSRLDLQIEIARSIQRALLPEEEMRFNGIAIHFWNRQSQIIGGDFGIVSPDAQGCWVILGDVMGKGLSASQFVPLMHGFIKDEIKATLSPRSLLEGLNSRLTAFIQEKFTMFVTVLAVRIDLSKPSKRVIHVSTAGHEGFFQISQGNVEALDLGGTFPLGLQDAPTYRQLEFEMAPDNFFFMMSDGITEGRHSDPTSQKNGWLCKLMKERTNDAALDSHSVIKDYLLRYQPPDDQTLISFHPEC